VAHVEDFISGVSGCHVLWRLEGRGVEEQATAERGLNLRSIARCAAPGHTAATMRADQTNPKILSVHVLPTPLVSSRWAAVRAPASSTSRDGEHCR
jgi:hypothetical protein